MPFGCAEPNRRRRTGSGAGDSPASVSSGDSPEEATVGFLPRMCFPQGQLVPLGSLGLEGGILLGFRSEMTRVRSSADCAFKPRRTPARNCVWESSFAAQPSFANFFRRVAGRDSGRRVACPTAHCPLPEVRLLFGAEYPKGIRVRRRWLSEVHRAHGGRMARRRERISERQGIEGPRKVGSKR